MKSALFLAAVAALAISSASAAECSKEDKVHVSFAKDPTVVKACASLLETMSSSDGQVTEEQIQAFCANKPCMTALKNAAAKLPKCEVDGKPLSTEVMSTFNKFCESRDVPPLTPAPTAASEGPTTPKPSKPVVGGGKKNETAPVGKDGLVSGSKPDDETTIATPKVTTGVSAASKSGSAGASSEVKPTKKPVTPSTSPSSTPPKASGAHGLSVASATATALAATSVWYLVA